ncbi:sulfatase-like hydrolase/transferase [Brevifollis gellanilyticus]|uniref:N-acetylgalactosamine-6-sulfatase n=1 Tax=Brevifollis gellanilyticus TaxID=748831 RepID=A0A512MBC5_9BACT|nr:sulfatase-like hydrolase/transferase [Brevifollis gellanilyticus]GEP44035.1 N-acetylgalactosamine-6-sulfatase [Brevifollis gellanilyticus]
MRCYLVLLFLSALGASLSAAPDKPNVIVILTDDQGYADVGFHNLPASRQALTPNLDRLASEGIMFKNGYVAFSTCGPSRQSLLTGRSASRFGVEENGFYATKNEIMLPRIIKDHGYTSAMFGKWHCGDEPDLTPKGRGFDESYETTSQDFFMKRLPHPAAWKEKGGMREHGPYLTDAITDEAIAFIRRNKSKPFFAYVAHQAPHSPFCTKEDLMQRIVKHAPEYAAAYQRMKTHTSTRGRKASYDPPNFDYGNFKGEDLDQELLRLTYLSMLLSVDDGVGKILDTLKEEGLRENTLIFYLSDNGGALARPNDLGSVNLPLRSGKGSVFEGGIRVPFVMSWPGTLEHGSVNSKAVVSSMDIFATTIELAGGKVPSDRIIDGVNLIPYLTGKKEGNPHEVLFFRRLGDGGYSIRNGDHKLDGVKLQPKVLRKGGDPSHYPEGGGFYDVQNDITEVKDLSAQFAEKKAETRRIYEALTKDFPVPLDTLPGARPGREE